MRNPPSLRTSRLLATAVLCCWVVQPTPRVYAAEDLCRPDPACSVFDDRGEQSFLRKDYATALDAFQQALAVKAEPRLILNIGRCNHRLGRYDEALRAYQQYTERVPSPPPDMRKRLENFIHEAQEGQRAQAAAKPARPSLLQGSASTGAPATTPVYRKWWFWTILGVAAAGAIVGGVAGGLTGSAPSFSRTVSDVQTNH